MNSENSPALVKRVAALEKIAASRKAVLQGALDQICLLSHRVELLRKAVPHVSFEEWDGPNEEKE